MATGGSRGVNCAQCGKIVYPTGMMEFEGAKIHKACYKCVQCKVELKPSTVKVYLNVLYCQPCLTKKQEADQRAFEEEVMRQLEEKERQKQEKIENLRRGSVNLAKGCIVPT